MCMVKGSKHKKESLDKLKASRKGKGLGNTNGFTKGFTPHNKGKPSPWTSARNKVVNTLRRAEKHWNWKGGTYGTERHREMGRQEYKIWRISVFERDNWTCQACGARGVYLEAHHPKTWKEYPELRFDVDNGVTLCKPCHDLITFSKNK